MPCVKVAGGTVCFGYDGKACINGRVYWFDWNLYFGPQFLRRRDGEPWLPGEKHEAWKAADRWFRKSRSEAAIQVRAATTRMRAYEATR